MKSMRMSYKPYKTLLNERKALKKMIAKKYHHKYQKKTKKWIPIKSRSLMNLFMFASG